MFIVDVGSSSSNFNNSHAPENGWKGEHENTNLYVTVVIGNYVCTIVFSQKRYFASYVLPIRGLLRRQTWLSRKPQKR